MMVSVPAIVFVGLASGWVMGISAAAWGALSVPLLILFGVEPLVAITSSLAASIVLSVFGGLTHWRYDRSRVAPLLPLLLGGVAGAFLGSFLSPALPTQTLRFLIGLMALSIGIVTLLRKNGNGWHNDLEAVKWHDRRAALFGIGGFAGVCAGAFGAGWGTIGVVLLIWTGIPPHTVVGSSLLARSLVASVAAGSYTLQAGAFPVEVFLPLLLAGGVGVYLGVRLANQFSAVGMQKFIGVVVTLVGALTVGGTMW
ncbi:MAG: sulfite exporter TauE/SafE family protein [Candidatus Methylomirabilales bacterium]